ncbi:hypothetical protein N7532_008051 [Penicillium argentinense]|uniref:Enoyl reductase (ER) domain-containing protein n=1 Tax=Penicillium argentinense TaxID=1131581 RepID=A0A9W9EWN7_9EURO|nr:uncharacterized protein N7532_008051 [Penicillium argentinense]KAJ5089367.1 hypothetical protein N7532_008051 [Penicillium argentinense]
MGSTGNTLVVRVPAGQPPQLVQEQYPLPSPNAGQVQVKVSHVAQNPTDVQCFEVNAFEDGAVLGCDFVGEVTELGSGVTRLANGDVVAGLIWGGRRGQVPGLGGYSEYTVADQQISFKLPLGISKAQASTVPLAAATAWLALFSKGCLNLDRSSVTDTIVLVWDGSSSVGLYTIHLASICGFDVITTCSPRNADLVQSCGAKHVFDYNDPKVIEHITQAAPNLQHIFDTIGNTTSSSIASRALGDRKGNLCTVRPGKANTELVTPNTHVTDILVWTAFLKDHRYAQFHWPASLEDHELSRELFENLPTWFEQGLVKPNKPRVLQGLQAVTNGLQEYRDGIVSAYKIVYKL